jgi:hypothetical protein
MAYAQMERMKTHQRERSKDTNGGSFIGGRQAPG